MPFASVRLVPGVNTEKTNLLNEAGVSQTSLIRYRDHQIEKLGGWELYFPTPVAGTPRALWGWQDLNQVNYLGVGTTTQLDVIANGTLQNITPQQFTSDFAPNFSTTINTATVMVVDPNIANVTTFDVVFFNTPISVGGLILSGAYAINTIVGATSYTFTAFTVATSSVANGGAVPVFTTTNASSVVSVLFTAHGLSVGNTFVAPVSTTVGGVVIHGSYRVVTVPDVNHFTITAASQATSGTTVSMNGGNAEIIYYINLGPAAAGVGYGLGGYGLGGYGTGVVPASQTGTPITATDWALNNWGEIFLANPRGGAIYYWQPNGGFTNASSIPGAPPFNNGIFVAMPEQILVAWGSSVYEDIGVQQDPMLVRWSDIENFFEWTVTSTTQAGSFRIPNGSTIKGGTQGPQQAIIWTDIDAWTMNYIQQPLIFGFNKVGSGAGLIAARAHAQLRGVVYWMGPSNFYAFSGSGVVTIPCTVWDAVFQNLDTTNADKCWAWPVTPFNEIWFFYPSSSNTTGECDSYVKYNVLEGEWDYGSLPRSCGIDQSLLGTPIAATPTSLIYQHEHGYNAAGAAMVVSFTTGYFLLGEGEDFAFVDQIVPDFKWGTFSGSQFASVQITFRILNFPSDTPNVYGPFTVTQATQLIATRFRGALMSITVASSDLNSFWRLGRVRYRFSPDGRR